MNRYYKQCYTTQTLNYQYLFYLIVSKRLIFRKLDLRQNSISIAQNKSNNAKNHLKELPRIMSKTNQIFAKHYKSKNWFKRFRL